jgi:hypothetical protein
MIICIDAYDHPCFRQLSIELDRFRMLTGTFLRLRDMPRDWFPGETL